DAGVGGTIPEWICFIAPIAGAAECPWTTLGHAAGAAVSVASQARVHLQTVGAEVAVDGDVRAEFASAAADGRTGGREHNQGPAIQFATDRVGRVIGDQQRPGAVDVRAGFTAEIAELAFGFEGPEEGRSAVCDGGSGDVVEGGALGATVAVIIA